MNRRDFLKFSGVSATAIALNGCIHQRQLSVKSAARRPNLVFVFPDQMRGQAMGFLKEEPVITPRLDRFAEEALVLPQAVSNYPVCSPYRAMLMSGRYPHANKVTTNCNSGSAPYNCELQETDRCWSDVLKDAGYSLGYIGKWHLDSPHKPYIKCSNNSEKFAWNEWCPPNRRHGFDFWYAYGTYDRHMRPLYWDTDAEREEFHYVNQWGPEHEADMATRYIKNEGGGSRDPNEPFALVVSMNPPHQGYKMHPKRYLEHYEHLSNEDLCERPSIPAADTKMGELYRNNIRHYYAMITGVDEQFGRILDALKQQGLEKDTIVVFTSDHGNCLGIHEMVSKNNRYEESMRVPFLIRYPGMIKPRQDDLLLSVLDVYPTLLDLMGFKADIPEQTDGISYAKLFMTGKGKRPDSQWYMWVPPGDKPAWGRRGLRTHRYTFVISKAEGKPAETILHDNVEDPYQLKNIAAEAPERVDKLTNELEKTLAKYGDPWLKS